MKKPNTLSTLLLLVGTLGFASCDSTSIEKLNDAKLEASKAEDNVIEAREEYIKDMENYKKETKTKISANEQSIKEFKARIATSKKEAKAEYDKKINDLEKQNTDLKFKMDQYKQDGKEKWTAFKEEFNHDMDELGKAIKDLTTDNKK